LVTPTGALITGKTCRTPFTICPGQCVSVRTRRYRPGKRCAVDGMIRTTVPCAHPQCRASGRTTKSFWKRRNHRGIRADDSVVSSSARPGERSSERVGDAAAAVASDRLTRRLLFLDVPFV
jgi:hypothetical protein